MNRSRRAVRLLVLLGAVLLFATCSRQKTGSDLSQQGSSRLSSPAGLNLAPDLSTMPGNTFQATFTDGVVKMEQAAFIKSIRSVSSDNTTFLFDPSDDAASSLHEGSILFVPGVALRKVDSSVDHGYQVRAPVQGHATWVISGAAFVSYYEIDTSTSVRRPAHMDGDLLVVNLNEPGVDPSGEQTDLEV